MMTSVAPPGDLETRHEENIVNFYITTSRDAVDWDMSWVYASKALISRGPGEQFRQGRYPRSQPDYVQ